jgi:hypothetical protein
MDVGCYCVSGSRLLAGGEPDRVHGEEVVGASGVDVRFTGVLRFGDATAEFMSSLTNAHQSLEAIGSEGSLYAPDPWHARNSVIFVNGREEHLPQVNSYKLELENVSGAIRGEAPLLLGREDALGQARTIEALYADAARNRSARS